MDENGFCSHVGFCGSTPEARLTEIGEHREQCGENISFGLQHAKEIVYHMLLDDGSPERGHRANLLNADFHFLGVAFGKHSSAQTSAVVLFADHFKARQATNTQIKLNVIAGARGDQTLRAELDNSVAGEVAASKAWDRLMQDLKPAHLDVASHILKAVQHADKPRIHRETRAVEQKYAVGSLLPKPGTDPSIVRAFVHRVDLDHDDGLVESEIAALNHKFQLHLDLEHITDMFDAILALRPPGGRLNRKVGWAEVFGEVQSLKVWVPVVDVHVELGSDKYQLTMEADVLASWCQEVYAEYSHVCDGLALPQRPASSGSDALNRSKPSPRNNRAAARMSELNAFLKSVLTARLTTTGLPLQREAVVQRLLKKPKHAQDARDEAGNVCEFLGAVCMSKRRLWAYHSRPFRETWLRLMSAAGLDPQEPKSVGDPASSRPIETHIQDELSKIQGWNFARSDAARPGTLQQSIGKSVSPSKLGKPKLQVRELAVGVQVRGPGAASTNRSLGKSGTMQPWEEKRHQTESLVNSCMLGDTASPGQFSPIEKFLASTSVDVPLSSLPEVAYSFEARRQFQEVLAKQQRASDERKFLATDPSPQFRSSMRGVGPTSLSAPGGVRGHFHNTSAVQAASGSHGWPQSLDVKWEGHHIDHSKSEPVFADPKMSRMTAQERHAQFSCYINKHIPDCAKMKQLRSEDQVPDVDKWKKSTPHEFRDEVPQRHGKFGRRAYEPQVRDRHAENPHGISQIENTPLEEFTRHQGRVDEFLHRSLPPGQSRHFEQHQPQAYQPGKWQEMANRAPVNCVVDGALKYTAHGYGQTRHTDRTDYKLYTRPLGASQMDRGLPLA
ncbi:unnamed protein product [Polarella glacialis]|uniref:SCP domain-containing protein n=1 Tax=Polarella glacialis TaxID=89957 RepID=A0A813IRX7_POLGL|nr:unnamed protein product [Polarella glacialis]